MKKQILVTVSTRGVWRSLANTVININGSVLKYKILPDKLWIRGNYFVGYKAADRNLWNISEAYSDRTPLYVVLEQGDAMFWSAETVVPRNQVFTRGDLKKTIAQIYNQIVIACQRVAPNTRINTLADWQRDRIADQIWRYADGRSISEIKKTIIDSVMQAVTTHSANWRDLLDPVFEYSIDK